MRNIFLFGTFLAAFALIAGCGGGGLATISVTGTVTLDGEPVPHANVTFTPRVQGEGDTGFAITDANGHYRLQTLMGAADAGTTPGLYDVFIIAWEQVPSVEIPLDAGSSSGPTPPRPQPRSLLPARYASTATSGLEANVVRGQRNVFNFELTTQP